MEATRNGGDRQAGLSSRIWRNLRKATQVVGLLLFLYLLVGTGWRTAAFPPHDLFFRLDPMAGAAAMLAGRQWIAPLALGMLTIVSVLALGRAWCGWLCPLGTLLDWTRLRPAHKEQRDLPTAWRKTKYFLLFAIIIAAVFGNLTLLVLDPLSLLFRTISSVVLPGVGGLINATETTLYNVAWLQVPVERFDEVILDSPLSLEQPFYLPNLAPALFFVGVLSLNVVRPRFWCRYLCPLGALLGLIAKVSWLRHRVDQEACTSCNRCVHVCHTDAISPESSYNAEPVECTLCLDCVVACPSGAVGFDSGGGRLAPWGRYDPSRRQALASLGIAAAGIAFLRVPFVSNKANPGFVQPPGAMNNNMLSRCIRCGECVKVCPTGALQPSYVRAGLEGFWSPVMAMRLGYCDYSCNACGEVCPTGAIPALSLEDKRRTVIGAAHIDENRCIPFAEGYECIVCEEMCPVPRKAIELRKEEVTNLLGERSIVRQPYVVRDLCIGCGICEYQCPVDGRAAIVVQRT